MQNQKEQLVPTKRCARCREHKVLDDFHNEYRNKDKKAIYCKPCKKSMDFEYRSKNRLSLAEYSRTYYKENKEKCLNSTYRYALKNKESTNDYKYWWRIYKIFGLTKDDYNNLLKSQDYKCKICGSDNPKSKRLTKFTVDHCHTTGKVRGLLCNSCNNGLGHFEDKIESLENAIEYLKNHYGK